MEMYKIKDLSFRYPKRESKAIDNVNLCINRGEFVTVCGQSGCGKTTLLRLLKSSLAPNGNMGGAIYFDGQLLSELDIRTQAEKIGFVMQNPDNQIVTDKVWHELAFGLESLGCETDQIRARVSEMASFFGIHTWFHKKTSELSGGQKQILNLASAMVLQPAVLVLDEPTSQLDPIAASEFLKALERINRELGTTVIISEHRLQDVFSLSDRVVVMDKGRIIADSTPQSIGKILKSVNHNMYAALPVPIRVHGAVENDLPCPVTVRDGKKWLEKYSESHVLDDKLIPEQTESSLTEPVIELKDIWFRYERDLADVIKGMNLSVYKGELFAVVGGNGAGKTTALSIMSGLCTPYRGKVIIKGEEISKIDNLYNGVLGVLPQAPHDIFLKKTVFEDIFDVLPDMDISEEDKNKYVRDIAAVCRIEDMLSVHPYDLSGGEQQRAALAKILAKNPEILILDEPTKGMDAHFKEIFASVISELKAKGKTIVMVSHDIEFCAQYADRCALFFDGGITSSGRPREFFAGKSFYTTSANRMARDILPKAVIAEDIIAACGGENKKSPDMGDCQKKTFKDIDDISYDGDKKVNVPELKNSVKQQQDNGRFNKSTLAAYLITLLAVPLTIYAGICFFGDRKYYFISMLIILETFIPFLMLFENRKPRAREIILISVLCSIAVASRTVFFMVPHFKPIVALVIISGVCLGGEGGFLVGAISAFVSNFFFGQGPWTPWQMFALGLVGFISGLLYKKGIIRRNRVWLSIFGASTAFFLYGGIMNSASLLMFQSNPTWEMFASLYIAGVPFDLIHAASTAIFLWLISEPMIDKIERVKIKYGLMERI